MASPPGQEVPLSLLPWPAHLGDHPNFPLPPTGPPEADVKAEPGVPEEVFPRRLAHPHASQVGPAALGSRQQGAAAKSLQGSTRFVAKVAGFDSERIP